MSAGSLGFAAGRLTVHIGRKGCRGSVHLHNATGLGIAAVCALGALRAAQAADSQFCTHLCKGLQTGRGT
jgi:hypothetical protein